MSNESNHNKYMSYQERCHKTLNERKYKCVSQHKSKSAFKKFEVTLGLGIYLHLVRGVGYSGWGVGVDEGGGG